VRRVLALALALFSVIGVSVAVVIAAAGPASAATTAGLVYVPLAPRRVVDTANSAPAQNRKGSIHANTGTSPTMYGVPASAAAVAVTVTAFGSSAAGSITAYTYGTTRPGVTDLQFAKGATVSSFMIVGLSKSKINLFDVASTGAVQLIVDLSGYYVPASGSTTAGLTRLLTPTRVVDTRKGTDGNHLGAVAAHAGIEPLVTGVAGGVPSSAGEVLASVSVVSATGTGSVMAYASSLPTESSVHFVAGHGTSSLLMIPIESTGRIKLYNNSTGTVHLIVDVLGYVQYGPSQVAGSFERLPVTRVAASGAGVAANGNYSVDLRGKGGVPLTTATDRAVWLTVHVSAPKAAGSFTVESGGTAPAVRNLSFTAGQTTSNTVLVPLSSSGTITVHNSSAGSALVYVDIYGYVAANTVSAPGLSNGRYLRSVTAVDPESMALFGSADHAIGSHTVLLEFGAQTEDEQGVILTVTRVKESYAAIEAAMKAYLGGYGPAGSPVTIAMGTNNDGDATVNNWKTFTANERGATWAAVVKVVQAYAPANVTVVGANDIEPGFYSTQAQAAAWVSSFVASGARFIFNGSADGCPSTFGATSTCNYGWTMPQLYAMASGPNTTALPQIYGAAQALQWANIDLAGGRGLVFAGVLTEHGSDPAGFTPAVGWSALYRTLTAVKAVTLPGPVDLQTND
jgi:hypothetical protein